MKIAITRTVELSEQEIGLLKLIHATGFQWSYACDEYYPEDVFQSLNFKGLTNEDDDGRARISADGYNALSQINKEMS
jgi:hypothetical protein